MPAWMVVTQKELRDAIRDRRALMALLLFPVMGPAMIYFMLNAIIDFGEEAADIELPVVGVDNAPDLMGYLRENGVTIEAVEATPETVNFGVEISETVATAIRGREYDFVLIVPDDFSDRLAASRPVNLELHHDSSRTAAAAGSGRVADLIQAWSREAAALRLLVRGISPDVIRPVNLTRIDVANDQARAQSILTMMPMFVVMAAFICGMGLAVDATAGERERKSLEPLLVNPVPRTSIVLGKWFAAVAFSILGLLLVMTLNLAVLGRIPLEELGFSFTLGTVEIAGILMATLPLAFFATSIQMFLGIFARSFKDAQAYLSIVMLLPVVPFFFNIFNTNARENWMNFVPMLGQHMLLTDVISGRPPPLTDFALAGATIFVLSLLLIHATSYLFRREKVIFT